MTQGFKKHAQNIKNVAALIVATGTGLGVAQAAPAPAPVSGKTATTVNADNQKAANLLTIFAKQLNAGNRLEKLYQAGELRDNLGYGNKAHIDNAVIDLRSSATVGNALWLSISRFLTARTKQSTMTASSKWFC